MSTPLRLSSTILSGLKALFPESTCYSRETSSFQRNPWYIVAAVAFSASNKPEGVPQVFQYVLEDLKANPASSKTEERLVAQKLREALFKSGLISGYPKVINALKSLHDYMPEELKETKLQRDSNMSFADYSSAGDKLWNSVYGEKAASVQNLLDSVYPDMGWFSKTIGYGLVYSQTDALSPLETSYTLVAALIAGDTPQQIAWHLDGAQRGGASLDEVKAVRQLSMEVAKLSGVEWRHAVPEVDST